MHRSSSHIGSLHDYKPKKLWKSIVSKDASKQDANDKITRTNTMSSSKSKRNTMVISEPSSIRANGLKRLSIISGHTLLDQSAKDSSIDPKEREFYAKLNSNRHQSIYMGNDDEDDADDSSMHFINMDEPSQENDTLSSALEDYKIFTKKSQPSQYTKQEVKQSRMASLPSFSSATTIDSEISVLHVSNSLWIGSTLIDLEDENLNEKDFDHFRDFDIETVFREEDQFERTHRTSLIFV